MQRRGLDDLLGFIEVARELSFTRAEAKLGAFPDWTPPFAGYHLYYPSRRQATAAFTVLLETLRYPRPA